jgi:hypothetical protein
MWIMTKSAWPVLINSSRAAAITYQQIVKFDPRTRIVASAWEQEHLLADCENGEQAKAVMQLIADALADGTALLDLRGVDLARLAAELSATNGARLEENRRHDAKPAGDASRSYE